MAFIFAFVAGTFAVSLQTSFSAAVTSSTVTATTVTNTDFAASYTSPWIPNNPFYTADLLKYPPYHIPCDCNFYALLDPVIAAEVRNLAEHYHLRVCDVQQIDRIINNNMAGINNLDEIDMLRDIAASIRREQLRRGWFFTQYSDFCFNYRVGVHPLMKRYPNYVDAVADAVLANGATAGAAAGAAVGAAAAVDIFDDFTKFPYYYSMVNFYNTALPRLSWQLQHDLLDSVYRNTPLEYLPNAYPLTQQLKSNVRGLLADTTDVIPDFRAPDVHVSAVASEIL